MADTQKLILDLFDIQAVKFGNFKLKSGIMSPIYLDLRVIVSFPEVLTTVANLMWEKTKELKFDLLCGVPYTALPIATVMCVNRNVPMVMRRKEKKEYGTAVLIEGRFTKGQTVLIIEDIVTSGASIIETMNDLKAVGLVPSHSIVMVNREQGGQANVESHGSCVHSVLTLPLILDVLASAGRITPQLQSEVMAFVKLNDAVPVPATAIRTLPFGERATLAANPVAKRLFTIMQTKRSNLSFNPDVTSKAELLRLTDLVGPEICMLKTHIDVVSDFDDDLITQLTTLAQKHNFILFEDRKFADIGNTVKHQLSAGVFKIAQWADMVNCHLLPGAAIVEGLRQAAKESGRDMGLLLIAEMSSKGNLITPEYTAANVAMAAANPDFVMGFISMKGVAPAHPGMVCVTPGVQLAKSGDGLGQQYNTPQAVIAEQGSDIIQVGRGIFGAADVPAEARKYREAAWAAYESRL